MIFGDFCMSPYVHTDNFLPSSIQDYFRFYTTCDDTNFTNPFKEPIQSIETTILDAVNALNSAETYCGSGNADLEASIASFESIQDYTMNIIGELECQNTKYIIDETLADQVCGNFMEGVYSLYVVNYILAVLFIFLLCFTTHFRKNIYSKYLKKEN